MCAGTRRLLPGGGAQSSGAGLLHGGTVKCQLFQGEGRVEAGENMIYNNI